MTRFFRSPDPPITGSPDLRAQAAFFLCALPSRCARFDNSDFAFSSSVRLAALRPRPARLMKYVSIRMPEPGPLGETFFEASTFAMVLALFVNRPAGG